MMEVWLFLSISTLNNGSHSLLSSDHNNVFQLHFPGKDKLTVECSSGEEKALWLKLFNDASSSQNVRSVEEKGTIDLPHPFPTPSPSQHDVILSFASFFCFFFLFFFCFRVQEKIGSETLGRDFLQRCGCDQ